MRFVTGRFSGKIIGIMFTAAVLSGCKTIVSSAANVLFTDNFESPLDPKSWKIESEKPFAVKSGNGVLSIEAAGGISVWLTKKLNGNYQIEFIRRVIMQGGKNDRLSDLNVFWQASDSKSDNPFTRTGKFEDYDSMQLYYVGMGGNTNTTTRFRKYHGNGEKPLLQEYSSAEYLLKPNTDYKIKILVKGSETSFWVDGNQVFYLNDPQVLREGYFAFRTTHSRHEIRDFKITRLK